MAKSRKGKKVALPEENGVEQDPSDDTGDIVRPYDPKLIRVDPKTFSIRQVIDMIEDDELDLNPEFQRNRVWKPKQKSLLIESLLLRVPLPAFYFSADSDGLLQVVDGVQRLSTIREFFSDQSFPLTNLEYLENELGGKVYKQLEKTIWSRRILTTQITVNVIDPQTPDAVKFDIFKRINTGGTPLTAQEIRHCMSRTRSRELLRTLAESKSFDESTGGALKNNVRMADRELVLRFCAFYLLKDIDAYSNYQSMDDFLTTTVKTIDDENKISDSGLQNLIDAFHVGMKNSYQLFGEHAFRKWPLNVERRTAPINRALFEVWSVLLSGYDWNRLERKKSRIIKGARKMMKDDEEFDAAISVGTSSPAKVSLRFERIRELLTSVGL